MANPKASIVILSKNPPQALIEQLKAQTFQDFEIVYAKERGILFAMNLALDHARGDIFIRIDDDVKLPPHWLENLMKPFDDPDVCGATGPTFVPKERRNNRDSIRYAENPHWFLKWLYDNGKFMPAGIYKCGCVSYDSNYEERFKENYIPFSYEPDHLEGTNWAMRTELIRKVGGFDKKFDGVCEWFDDDVTFKIKKLGYRLAYRADAYLYHLLEKGGHYSERFEGWGRIKNFLRFHIRHGTFHPKMALYLLVWWGYFVCKKYRS